MPMSGEPLSSIQGDGHAPSGECLGSVSTGLIGKGYSVKSSEKQTLGRKVLGGKLRVKLQTQKEQFHSDILEPWAVSIEEKVLGCKDSRPFHATTCS